MSASAYLDVYLAPFLEQLARPDVTDLYVNRVGELWIETLHGRLERHIAPEITEAQLWRLARQVASLTHQGISREHPLLAARLPDGARVQIVAPPATREGMAIAIRKHVSSDLSIADYEQDGAFACTSGADAADPIEEELARLHEARDWGAFLRAAVRARKTIVVSGGTSTGKTTFLNALLREIDAAERLVLIEDTPELVLRHKNAIGLVAARGGLGEANVTMEDLLIASLRLRPDRIILGELRGAEASTFLRAINTGHPGSLTTIHADTPTGAIEQLVLLVLQSGARLRRDDILAYIDRVVDIVVQLERRHGERRITQIDWVRQRVT
ncbi:P-type DNA transfer ATPase VirB11 [Sphingomonas sp. Leaf37]|uniref:P-type DNA transfer ATPase VirB11 n=1 Tax=Sphingomonas sp. Leaf37 TaxID=2876552 RepID=UPI001E4A2EC4|nr:P-type DNA transfer ATPase VirB11 [Sphingomonas sp. Leaf37]